MKCTAIHPRTGVFCRLTQNHKGKHKWWKSLGENNVREWDNEEPQGENPGSLKK